MKLRGLFLVLLCASTTFAQKDVLQIFTNEVSKCLKINNINLKDTTAVYCFAMKISVDLNNKSKKITHVSFNDSLANNGFIDYDKMELLNFRSIMRKHKKVNIIVPICIIVVKYKKGSLPLTIPLADFPINIRKLFDDTGSERGIQNTIFTNPVFVSLDKTIYD